MVLLKDLVVNHLYVKLTHNGCFNIMKKHQNSLNNKNKIQVNTGDPDIPKITIPIDGELIKLAGEAESIPIKFEDSSLVFKDVDLYGSIPLDSCPTNTPDVLEGLIVVYAMAEAFSEMGQY